MDSANSSSWQRLTEERRDQIISAVIAVPICLAFFWVFGADMLFKFRIPHVPEAADCWASGFQVGGILSVVQCIAYFILSVAGTAAGFLLGEGMLHTARTDSGTGAFLVQQLGVLTALPLTLLMAMLYMISMSEGILIGPFLGAVVVGVGRIVLGLLRIKLC